MGDAARDGRDEKRLRWFDDVRIGNRPRALVDLAQLLRDRFSARGQGEQLFVYRFAHGECFAEGERSSIGEGGLFYKERPTASATARKRGTSSLKISGVSACAPSLLASSGES